MKIFAYPSPDAEGRLSAIIDRGLDLPQKQVEAVTQIIQDVRNNGDRAVLEYTRRFDCPTMAEAAFEATPAEFDAAAGSVNESFLRALNRAVSQIEAFHSRQRSTSWIDMQREGTLLGQLVNPVGSAGVYAPGGKEGSTPLVSTVLMGAIPAKIAGVKRVCLATPPRKDGSVDPHLLVAARKTGVDAVYKMGSAWAIAALAYGTETVPGVDVIVGPGNIYVNIAKQIVSQTVGIDMIAGPSEILIIADDAADPEFIAADLLSQAEHDPLAAAILLTDSTQIAEAAAAALERRLAALTRKDIAEESIRRFGTIITVQDIDDAFDIANRIAPEHLELHVADPVGRLGKIRNAGAVFLGDYTPEPVGDYIAGPNHVLPTAGTARFSSALSVDNFIKKTSIVHYSRAAFEKEADDILCLACIEGLDAHANSVKARIKKG